MHNIVLSINTLNHLFLRNIERELTKNRVRDLNSLQALTIYNIGIDGSTISKVQTNGFKIGTNVTYNILKLEKLKYIFKTPNIHDERSICIKLTEKGIAVINIVDSVIMSQSELLKEFYDKGYNSDIKDNILFKLQKIWSEE
jgi:DNA-binding MarR family transcriptional regulator